MIDHLSDIWHTPDGWPLRRVKLTGRSGRGRGSLLFLSGRGDHMEKYAETLHHWADQGWVVENFDWRGQGGSGRFTDDSRTGHAEDLSHWIDDLEAYCAEWRARTDAPHVIVAHSMGGHIALRALAEDRIEADAVVLIAPMFGINAAGLPHGMGSWLARTACALGHSTRPVLRLGHRRHKVMNAVRTTLTHSAERYEQEARVRRERPDLVMDAPSWGWLRAAYSSISVLNRPGYVENVTTPVLILATRGDRLISVGAVSRIARRLPHAEVHYYGREVAHEILREVDRFRDDALARIDAFFDRHARSGDIVSHTAASK